MADFDAKNRDEKAQPEEPEVAELDDNSLEDASGGQSSGPIIINNCDC